MVFGTRDLKYWVLGPSGNDVIYIYIHTVPYTILIPYNILYYTTRVPIWIWIILKARSPLLGTSASSSSKRGGGELGFGGGLGGRRVLGRGASCSMYIYIYTHIHACVNIYIYANNRSIHIHTCVVYVYICIYLYICIEIDCGLLNLHARNNLVSCSVSRTVWVREAADMLLGAASQLRTGLTEASSEAKQGWTVVSSSASRARHSGITSRNLPS